MNDPVLHECFEQWPAWGTLVGYVSRSNPADADPQSIFGAACGCDQERLAALLHAHGAGRSFDDAKMLLAELLAMARDGRRPRYGRELGLTRDMFGLDEGAAA